MRRSSFLLVAIAMIATVLFGASPTQAQVPMPIVKVYAERLDCTTIRIIDAYHNTNDVLDVSLRWNVGDPAVTYSGTGEPTKSGAWTKTFSQVPMPKTYFGMGLNITSGNKTKYYFVDVPGCELKNQVVPGSVQNVADASIQDNVLVDRANTRPVKLVKVPKVLGNPVVGNTVRSDYGTWKPRPDLLAGLWYRLVKGRWELIKNGQDVYYKISPADKGHKIAVMQIICASRVSCGLAVSKPVLVK